VKQTLAEYAPLSRIQSTSLAVGVVGGLLAVGAAVVAPREFFPAYLVSFLFWLGISLGSLAISMIHHLTGGGWGVPVRRIMEAATTPLPLMAVLFLPIVYALPVLYVWSRPEVVASDEILQRKVDYLNVNGFLIRAVIYFAIWSFWSFALNRATANSEADVQQRRQRGLALFSAGGLVLWGLAVTFAAIDWGMSIEPHWFSSMYGVLYMAGQGVSGLALCALFAVLLRPVLPNVNVLTTSRLHDLGNFLLAFVMFWSYVSFMQYLIIWSANLPEETPWYLRRGQGGWQVVVVLLMVAHFLIPFLLLLMRQMKRNARRLAMIAGLLLGMRLVDLTWLILPSFSERLWGTIVAVHGGHGPAISPITSILSLWPLLVTVPAIGGLWLAVFVWRLKVRATLPVHTFPDVEEPNHAIAGDAAH
jgi:hypothetical protein